MRRRSFKITLLMDKNERINPMTQFLQTKMEELLKERSIKVTYFPAKKKWWEFWR